MSRETDSSSSGPQGRGGAAYPSGTPPYGSRQYPSLHPQQDAPEETGAEPAPQPDEPRTETTLTTRIRINIPGSRPIPPVVMRTPMSDVATGETRDTHSAERTASIPRPDAGPDVTDARRAEAAEEKPPADKPTSDWFAPRKPSPSGAGAGPGAGTTSGAGTGSGMSAGMGAGAAAVSGAVTPPPAATGDRRSESPYYSGPSEGQGSQGPGAQSPTGGGSLSDLAAGPGTDSSTTGSHRFPSGPGTDDSTTGSHRFPSGPGTDDSTTGSHRFPSGPTTPPLGTRTPGASGPGGPTTGPAYGGSPLGTPPGSLSNPGAPGSPSGARLSDDTAVLTPQQPAPEPGPGGNVSGDTLTSGIPVVPAEQRTPFPGSGPIADPLSRPGAPGPDDDFSAPDFPGPVGSGQGAPPSRPAPPASTKPSVPAKKGRSKLMLLGVALFVIAGGVYGAGLLMNHSDVPKGTTVLGVDIGGGTRDAAVIKLDSTLGKRAAVPLRLAVDGKTQTLAPDKAGLSLDSQATVRGAAGSDYNPVSVIGSLFGGPRVAEPVIPVDEEKLAAALTDLAGTSGSASEGTIKFEPGRAVAVPGKSGKALDVNHSIISVRDAYRAQVQTGKTKNIELPAVTREPTISQAELDRAMNDFAKPAMSDLVTIKAGAKQIQFGPAKSLPKILSMKPVDGKLVEVYNRNAIDQLLDGVFDGITVTRGNGKQYPVSSADVAQAMQRALRGKTPEERTQEISLDPS
ncbi:hypothetical protein ACIOJD_03215 [Streptomyces sp. NPDC088116]|uniref:hypothetical protein n=1 Tax=Streptomyces sp. NPDC088116 TaxID=3365825 RepID=UPI00382F0E3E